MKRTIIKIDENKCTGCGGLLRLAQTAAVHCKRKVPVKTIGVDLKGEILRED